MKISKKIVSWLIVFSFLLLVVGCAPASDEATTQKDFEQFLKDLPAEMMSNDDLNLEFTFENPENYGFEQTLLELPFNDFNDYKETNEQTKELLKKLDQFSYKQLTSSQQLTYDILEDYLKRNQMDEDFYYLDNNYLGSFVGFQAQLPLLLNEYTFERENDLNSYFHILETSPEVFKKYADNEKERQKYHVGMSQDILDKVIQQCDNFVKNKDVFLIESINKKIDQVSFYDNQQKQAAKEKNEKLLKENFVKAYEDLGRELSSIEANTAQTGLANLENGKKYYEYLLKKTTGIDDSIKDISRYLKNKLSQKIIAMSQFGAKNPELVQNFDFDKIYYSSLDSFEENIDYLSQAAQADYPTTDKINYDITIVPDSMKENFSPAAYLVGKIDASDDAVEHIWVNGKYERSLFLTLAHEGYPGHMYQHTYFKRLQLPTIRYLMDYSGYSEGWATYIENNAYKYVDGNEEQMKMLELYQLNQDITQCLISLMDIGIHYEGWSYEKYVQEIKQYFDMDDESLKQQYDLIVETPTNYLHYYLNGMKYQDLYDHAKDQLGDQFNAVEFNKVLLETGPSSLSILEKQVEKYINNQTK